MAKKVKKGKVGTTKKKLLRPQALPKEESIITTSFSRNDLMLKAKDCGIKNFRVLNKAELTEVLGDGVTPERIQAVVASAVARWKSGWGTKRRPQDLTK